MSKINDVKEAKRGIAGLFGGVPSGITSTAQSGELPSDLEPMRDEHLNPEELIESLQDEETRDLLKMNLARRQYQNSGRPQKGHEKKETGYIRRTYLVNAEKADKLAELSIQETRFLKELLDEALDLLFEKYNK